MVNHVCKRCGKSFDRKSNYDYHLKRKTPCIVTETVSRENNADISDSNNEIFDELQQSDTQEIQVRLKNEEVRELLDEVKREIEEQHLKYQQSREELESLKSIVINLKKDYETNIEKLLNEVVLRDGIILGLLEKYEKELKEDDL